MTVAALEQLANLQTRCAEHLWRDTPKKTPGWFGKVNALFRAAERLLNQLTRLDPSAERDALLGGLEKRRAMTRRRKAEMVVALRAMEAHYRDAYELKASRKQDDAFYPFINAVVARLARSWLGGGDKAEPGTGSGPSTPAIPSLRAEINRLVGFEEDLQNATDFWSLGFLAEAALIRVLHSKQAAKVTEGDLIERYRIAQNRGSSRREMDSVVTQIRFLTVVAGQSSDPRVEALGEALQQLARQLTDTTG